MLTLAAAALAAITVTRSPSAYEGSPPKDPGLGASDKARENYDDARTTFDRTVDAIARTDLVAQAELPLVAACWGRSGSAEVSLTIAQDGTVRRVQTTKTASPELAACLDQVYEKKLLPVLTQTGDTRLDWTVQFEPPATPPDPDPIDRDLGFGGIAFGQAPVTLGSSSVVKSTNGLVFYSRELDPEVRWLGVKTAGINYGFDADDRLFATIVQVEGDTGAFALRGALKTRYGQPRWDPVLRAWYWRGDRTLILAQDFTAGDGVAVTLLDIELARATGRTGHLPGDPVKQGVGTLPRIFSD